MNTSKPSLVSNFNFALRKSDYFPHTESIVQPTLTTPPTIVIHDSDSSSSSQMITLDSLEPSTTTTHVEPEVAVGSGDTAYARKQLRLVSSLRDIG